MKNKNVFRASLISSIIMLVVSLLVRLLFRKYKILIDSNDPIWPDMILQNFVAGTIFFFIMYYWMKRKIKKEKNSAVN